MKLKLTNLWRKSVNKNLITRRKLIQKKKKNPIPSAIASPPITNFFSHAKKKKLEINADKSNDAIIPKTKSKLPPLYHTQCNGIFSLSELLNANVQKFWERNELLQNGLKVCAKYFAENNETYCVNAVSSVDFKFVCCCKSQMILMKVTASYYLND